MRLSTRGLPWVALGLLGAAVVVFYGFKAAAATSYYPVAFATLGVFAAVPLLGAAGIIGGALLVRRVVGEPQG